MSYWRGLSAWKLWPEGYFSQGFLGFGGVVGV